MKVTIYGSGYVGLVTGICFAEVGNDVLCVDVDQQKIARLQQGECPIYEPGLQAMLQRNLNAGRLAFTTDMPTAVAHGALQFIAVGTPPDEDGSADLSYVLQVAHTVGEYMDDYRVLITKSTVPVTTADKVHATVTQALAARDVELEFDVASNPEFLKEGDAINDFMKPDRVVIGTDSARAEKKLRKLYAPFNRNHDRVLSMDIRSAELTKYAANAMLATKISFMNELSNLADAVDADIENVRIGIGSDRRIGFDFIYPGCGYGGSCFPKDVKALVRTAREYHTKPMLLEAVEAVNEQQKHWPFNKLKQHFGESLAGKTIAVWGLSFKPKTDDMREAPSRVLMTALWEQGCKVQAYDPVAMDEATRIYGQRDDLTLVDNAYAAVDGADALVTVTEWQDFRNPDFARIKASLRQPVIIDGRNMYDPETLSEEGFTAYFVGRPGVAAAVS